MVANCIEHLLLEFADLPWVLERTIFPGGLSTLAGKVGADFLEHVLGNLTAFTSGLWRKNMPILVTLRLAESVAPPERQAYFKRWAA